MVIYGDNFPVFSGVYGKLAMILFLSTTLVYVAALHMVRKQYTVTFDWQMENRESAGKIEMADLSKEVQEKTEGKADNSSKV